MRSHGNWRRGALCAFAACAAAALAWPRAEAADQAVTALKAVCSASADPAGRARALEDLRTRDTADSRKAIEDLAASPDPRLAVQAVATMGRGDWSAARSKLRAAFEDAARPDAVRAAAFIAWARLAAADGTKWSEIEAYAAGQAAGGSKLRSMCDAAKSAVCPE